MSNVKRTERWKTLVIFVAPILLLGAAAVIFGLQEDVDSLLRHYTDSPDAQTAGKLVKIVEVGEVGNDVQQRIMQTLLTPKVYTRPAYRAGSPVGIAIWIPQPLCLDTMKVTPSRPEFNIASGRWSYMQGSTLDNYPVVLDLGLADKLPGTYTVNVSYSYRFERVAWLRTRWYWPNGMKVGGRRYFLPRKVWNVESFQAPAFAFSCSFDLPVTVTLTDAESVKTFDVKRDDELGKRMKQAFRVPSCNLAASSLATC